MAFLKKAAAFLLAFILVLTAGLYIFANKDEISAAISNLFPQPSEPVTAGESFTRYSSVPFRGGVKMSGESISIDGPASFANQFDLLPSFVHGYMLSRLKDGVSSVIYILTDDYGNANLYYAVKDSDGNWKNMQGPVYCTITDASLSALIGWHKPMNLYHRGVYAGRYPSSDVSYTDFYGGEFLQSGLDRLADAMANAPALLIDIPGSETASTPFFIYGGEGDGQRGISLATADMNRLAANLSDQGSTMVGIFPAVAAGVEISPPLPEDFVYLYNVAPQIMQDVRYAGSDNFVGRPLDGYEGNSVILHKDVAAALKTVAESLENQGLGLLVYDGYRPKRAVEDIFRWLASEDAGQKEEFYPDLDKNRLKGTYLAEYSRHCQGIAVDLTLYNLETLEILDMGTSFDFFSPLSWHGARGITDEQANNRRILKNAMSAAGFSPYVKEWWHFNYSKNVGKLSSFDFIVPQ